MVIFVIVWCLIPHKSMDAKNDTEVGIWLPGFMKGKAKAIQQTLNGEESQFISCGSQGKFPRSL